MAPETKSWDNPELLFALATAVANDTVPQGLIAPAYLVANEKGSDESIMRAGSNLYKNGRASSLLVDVIPDEFLNHSTYQGFEVWRQMLVADGVHREKIRPIMMHPAANPPGSPPPVVHTGFEISEIVNLAESEKWNGFYIVAYPTHMLRSFALAVTFLTQKQLQIPVFAHTGPPLSGWCHKTVLNQGLRTGMILGDGTSGELARLKKTYGNRFDIAPAETVLAYLKWRDSNGEFPFPANPFA